MNEWEEGKKPVTPFNYIINWSEGVDISFDIELKNAWYLSNLLNIFEQIIFERLTNFYNRVQPINSNYIIFMWYYSEYIN